MAIRRIIQTAIFLCMVCLVILWPSVYVLELIPGSSASKPVARYPVEPGDRFTIDYIHSWDKTPVLEIFEVQKDSTLLLVSTEYSWLGTGLEYNPPHGTLIHSEKGTTIITGINREIETLHLRVGWKAQHQLTINNRTILLSDYITPGESVLIRIRRKPLFVGRFIMCKTRWKKL